jgi:hypothetical protein
MKHRLYQRFRQVVDEMWTVLDQKFERDAALASLLPKTGRLTDIVATPGFLETAGLDHDTSFLLELGWLRGVSDAEGWPTTRAPGPEWRSS